MQKRFRSSRRQRGFWQWLIPAAAAIGSALLSKSGQESANETNLQLGREQMDFQEKMSNTAWQRGTRDMQAAGINPMLAVSQGPASAPQGSLPRVENTLAPAVASAQAGFQALSAVQQASQSEAQTENIKAMTDKIKSETMERDVNTGRALAEIRELVARGSRTNVEIDKTEEETKRTRAEAETARRSIDPIVSQRISQAEREFWTAQLAKDSFSADVARRRAESKLTEMEIPKAQAESDFFKSDFGQVSPWMRQILEALRGVSSAKRAFDPVRPRVNIPR